MFCCSADNGRIVLDGESLSCVVVGRLAISRRGLLLAFKLVLVFDGLELDWFLVFTGHCDFEVGRIAVGK